MIELENIQWLGHASFKIKANKVIYIDPWKLNSNEPADIVLITHGHYDHCSAQDIKKVQKENTVIVAPGDCTSSLSGNIKSIQPGQSLNLEGVTIEAVAAYNLGKPFHSKSNNWLGFIITLDNTKIYHAGDTDLVPEMDKIKADFVLLPIGGTYTMNAREAAQCANKIKPKVAIPMHYGSIVGDSSDAQEFKKLCDVEVQILEPKNG